MNCHHFIIQEASSNSVLPIIAIVISSISLIFSFLTARHNRKMVEPILADLYNIYHRTGKDDYSFQSYQLKNCGFGPAVIKSLTFTINDKEYKEITSLIRENSEKIIYDTSLSSTSMHEGGILPPKEEWVIFKICFSASSNDSFREFQRLLSNISIRVDYVSIYKEKKFLYTDKICRLPTGY